MPLKKIFVLGFLTLFFSIESKAQGFGFDEPKKSAIELINPYLPHVSNINGQKGFTLALIYPGYFSMYGQINVYYTNSVNDSYFFGIGDVFIMGGIQKMIKNYKTAKLYVHLNFGTRIVNSFLGSIGISYLKYISQKSRVVFALDGFFDHGFKGEMFLADKTYTTGLAVGIHYAYSITNSLILNIGIGFSYIQYRYMRYGDESGGGSWLYEYVTWQEEKESSQYDLHDPKWDPSFIIPFGITLSYHFQ